MRKTAGLSARVPSSRRAVSKVNNNPIQYGLEMTAVFIIGFIIGWVASTGFHLVR